MKNTTPLRSRFIIVVLAITLFGAFATSASAAGKRYGIFVGINDYPGDDNDLNGAVNDAKNLRNLLISKFRFLSANTTLLLDNNATRDNILGKIKSYSTFVDPGDELVFQYSGHGTLFPDVYSDVIDETKKVEVDIPLEDGTRYQLPLDYYDSALVPWDYDSTTSGKNWRGLILDDELYDLFSAITNRGATVVFISDSCHSGTVGKLGANVKFRFMRPERAFKVSNLADAKFKKPKNQKRAGDPKFNNNYIALTAARDDEVAWDGGNSNIPGGLFTSTLIEIIQGSKTPLTYRRLLALVQSNQDVLKSNQHPQLDRRFGNADSRIFEPVPVPVKTTRKQ